MKFPTRDLWLDFVERRSRFKT